MSSLELYARSARESLDTNPIAGDPRRKDLDCESWSWIRSIRGVPQVLRPAGSDPVNRPVECYVACYVVSSQSSGTGVTGPARAGRLTV